MRETAQSESSLEEIVRLTELARRDGDPEIEATIVQRRHRLGQRLLDTARPRGAPPLRPQDLVDLFESSHGRPPEIDHRLLDVDVLRSALSHHGCLLVHNFFPEPTIERLRADVDAVAEGFDRWIGDTGRPVTPSRFVPFEAPDAQLPFEYRGWCGALGTYYAGDSPRGFLDLIDAFDAAGLPALLTDYMREPVLLALEKSALRKVPKDVPSAWHQDGMRFGVDVGLVNVWVALSPCGTDAPTLGIVPSRPKEILPLDSDSLIEWEIDPTALAAFAGDLPLLELELEPGDAVIFDEMLVHATIVHPAMTKRRYDADAWFFPVSAFPSDLYIPLAYTT
jgi:hypothetical protein